jgi:hypothetical protein
MESNEKNIAGQLSPELSTQNTSGARRLIVFAGCAIAFPIAPVIFWLAQRNNPALWVHGTSNTIFFLWTLCGVLAFSISLVFDLKNHRVDSKKVGLYVVVVRYLVMIGALNSDCTMHDYRAYEQAAMSFVNGGDLYIRAYHANFPLVGECIGKAYQGIRLAFLQSHWSITNDACLAGIFYLFQCLQLYSVAIGYWLSTKLLSRWGLPAKRSTIICTCLWLLSWPIYLSIEYGQINLMMLDLTLLALLWSESWPVIAGILLAVAFFLKFYPLGVIAAAIICKRWKLTGAFLAGLLIMVSLQTYAGGTGIWMQMLQSAQDRLLSNPAIDGEVQTQPSITNAALIICRVFARDLTGDATNYLWIVSFVLRSLIVLWFGWRSFVRQKTYNQTRTIVPNSSNTPNAALTCFYAQAQDFLMLELLVSPHVWQMHYVMALPAILWAIANNGSPLVFAAVPLLIMPNPLPYGTAYLALAFLKPLGLILLSLSQDIKHQKAQSNRL